MFSINYRVTSCNYTYLHIKVIYITLNMLITTILLNIMISKAFSRQNTNL